MESSAIIIPVLLLDFTGSGSGVVLMDSGVVLMEEDISFKNTELS